MNFHLTDNKLLFILCILIIYILCTYNKQPIFESSITEHLSGDSLQLEDTSEKRTYCNTDYNNYMSTKSPSQPTLEKTIEHYTPANMVEGATRIISCPTALIHTCPPCKGQCNSKNGLCCTGPKVEHTFPFKKCNTTEKIYDFKEAVIHYCGNKCPLSQYVANSNQSSKWDPTNDADYWPCSYDSTKKCNIDCRWCGSPSCDKSNTQHHQVNLDSFCKLKSPCPNYYTSPYNYNIDTSRIFLKNKSYNKCVQGPPSKNNECLQEWWNTSKGSIDAYAICKDSESVLNKTPGCNRSIYQTKK